MKFLQSVAKLGMSHNSVVRNSVIRLMVPIVLMCSVMVHGQTNAGTLAGTAVDPNGLPVHGATITLTNNATGETATTSSNEAGIFRFSEVKPGVYSAVTTATGFKRSDASNIVVSVSQTTALNVQLQVGQAVETVTVSASAAELQTESSDIGTSVNPQLVNNLPISVGTGEMRSIIDFTFLVPGVVGGENVNKIAGGQATGSLVEVDGGSINTVTGGNFDAAGYTPSVDAVQEFTILEAGYPAQYGRSTGGIVNFGTLSGTNEFHGTAYDILHNTVLDANGWWNNLEAGANPSEADLFKRPVDMKNDYGFTIGGPVYLPHLYNGRKRTFFFFSWEQFRQNFGSVAISSVPTSANRGGDFSATLTNAVIGTNPCDGQPIYEGEIFDPTTTTQAGSVYCRTPFNYGSQLNHINPAVFSKVAGNVLSYMPLPQNSSLTNNYAFRSSYPIHITAETIRIDHSFSAKDKIFGSYNPHHFQQANQGQVIPGPGSPMLNLTQTTFLHDAHLGYDHTFSPVSFNHLILSIYRFTNFPQAPAAMNGINYSKTLGLGSNLTSDLFPTFNWGENYISMGSWLNYQDYQNHIELADNFIHTTGKHTLDIGADVQFQEFTRNFQLFSAGDYTFSRAETAGTNTLTTLSGNGFASFLLGEVSNAFADVQAVVPQRRQEYAALYIQDDYKAMPNLTLNLGLRYSVDVPFSEHYGNVDNWDPVLPDTNLANGILGGLVFSGTGPGRSGLSSRLADTYYKDFEPRLGFAWSPKALGGKTVLRGNYGIMYGPTPMNFPINGAPGFSDTPTFSDSLQTGGFTAPFSLDTGFPSFTKGVNTNPFQLDNTAQSPFYTARSYGRVAMVQDYGLQIQQELPHALLLSLAYTGNRSTHLSSNLLCLDCLSPNYYSLGSQLSQTYSSTTSTLSGYKTPYYTFAGTLAQGLQPFPQIGSVTTSQENVGQSSYNALYAKLQRNFANGFSMLASYTWAKTLTDADSTLVGALSSNVQDPFNLKEEKSISALDYPSVLAVSYVYELPFGRHKAFLNRGGALNALVGGWEISGIHRAQSGSPANFGCATGLPGDSPCFRFSLNPGVSVYSAAKLSGHFNPLTDVYFNPDAFIDSNSNARIATGGGYQYGTLRRNVGLIRYSVCPDSDFAFIKNTGVRDSINLQFRAELFNAFNQHRLGTPNQNPNLTDFGQINGTQNSARIGQMTLRVNF